MQKRAKHNQKLRDAIFTIFWFLDIEQKINWLIKKIILKLINNENNC